MSINYDFADLEVFLAVKETGSFHQAAERQNLSQSAVTRRIQKLETALGVALFDRSTRSVRPTLAAKRLQGRAEAILEDMRETTRAMRDESIASAHQRRRLVTLAMIPTVISVLLPAALAAFRTQGHETRLRLIDAAANEVSEAVAQGEADFGICSLPTLEPNTAFETLFIDRMVVALPQAHPLSAQYDIALQDLKDAALILPARKTGNRVLIDEAVAKVRGELTWMYEAERSASAVSLVAGAGAVALLPLTALLNADRGQVIWRPLRDLEIVRPIGLLTRAGQTDTRETLALKSALKAVAQTITRDLG